MLEGTHSVPGQILDFKVGSSLWIVRPNSGARCVYGGAAEFIPIRKGTK